MIPVAKNLSHFLMFIIFFLGRKLAEARIQCAENAFTKPLAKNMLLR